MRDIQENGLSSGEVSKIAERRMFSKKIVSSARFLRMPATARLLYYDLGMYADDDGVVEAFTVAQMTHAAMDDLQILVSRGFLEILNEDMVAYICDWKCNNFIRKDRYVPSLYHALLLQSTTGQPAVNPDEDRIGKDRIDQIRLDEERINESFSPQTDLPISVKECFINSFGREPDAQFLHTISKMLKNGLSEEEVLCHIRTSIPRSPRRPEAYILSILKALERIRTEQQDEPLSQWDLDWLERAHRYQAQKKSRQEVQPCEKEEN